jgi:hypothetical protein
MVRAGLQYWRGAFKKTQPTISSGRDVRERYHGRHHYLAIFFIRRSECGQLCWLVRCRCGRFICRADSFGQCLRDFLSVSRVIEIDSEVETENTLEIAELSPFTAAHAGVAWTGKNGDLKREE